MKNSYSGDRVGILSDWSRIGLQNVAEQLWSGMRGVIFCRISFLHDMLLGFLNKHRKEGKVYIGSKWQKRYCVVRNHVLYYFKDKKSPKQQGYILLTGYQVALANKKGREFTLTHPEGHRSFSGTCMYFNHCIHFMCMYTVMLLIIIATCKIFCLMSPLNYVQIICSFYTCTVIFKLSGVILGF